MHKKVVPAIYGTMEQSQFTLVIACRNEQPEHLPDWNCPKIIVDDHSDNSPFAIYNTFNNLKQTAVYNNPYPQGKKYALKYGIEQAQTEYVYLTDADTILPERPPQIPQNTDLLILPLKMQAPDTLLGQLQKAEYTTLQTATMFFAEKGRAIMCSGANLIARRDKWLECFVDLHPEIPSGDDMFLLQAFKKRGLNIRAMYGSDFTAIISAQPTLSKLLRQRMRWAGKMPGFSDKDILKIGTTVALSNFLSVVCPPLWLLKFACELWLWNKRKQYAFNDNAEWYILLLLSLIYPWYMLVCLIGGMTRKNLW